MLLSGARVNTCPARASSRLVTRQIGRRTHVSAVTRKRQLQKQTRQRNVLCSAYADGGNAADGLDEADDFYSILGVVCYSF